MVSFEAPRVNGDSGRACFRGMFSERVLCDFLRINKKRLRALMRQLSIDPRYTRGVNAAQARALMAEHYREIGQKLLNRKQLTEGRPRNRTPRREKEDLA